MLRIDNNYLYLILFRYILYSTNGKIFLKVVLQEVLAIILECEVDLMILPKMQVSYICWNNLTFYSKKMYQIIFTIIKFVCIINYTKNSVLLCRAILNYEFNYIFFYQGLNTCFIYFIQPIYWLFNFYIYYYNFKFNLVVEYYYWIKINYCLEYFID